MIEAISDGPRQCSEGVSFLSVRKTFLADVPVSPSGFIQQHRGRKKERAGVDGEPVDDDIVTVYTYYILYICWDIWFKIYMIWGVRHFGGDSSEFKIPGLQNCHHQDVG